MKELKDLKLKTKKEVQELDEKALKAEYTEAEKKLYVLKMKLATDELKQTHLIKFLRRYVALLKTIANQKGFNI